MAKPRIFISSTFLDLEAVRNDIATYFEKDLSSEVLRFEKGGVYFDATKPLDKSCYAQVASSDLFVLLIGGRYGSPDSSQESKTNYVSVTRREYETALEHNIPIYTFVKDTVLSEFQTYRNNVAQRKTLKFAHVDNWRIFELIQGIFGLKKNNPIWPYHQSGDIVEHVRSQMAGMLHNRLTANRRSSSQRHFAINPYKLFYYRDRAGLSMKALSSKADIPERRLKSLEKLPVSEKGALSKESFRKVTHDELRRIERALDISKCLAAGADDDFLSMYMQYYYNYKGRRLKQDVLVPPHLLKERTLFPARAVVFDFDGTLTRRTSEFTTWERIWTGLGYSLADCAKFHRMFSSGEITHAEWCEKTTRYFQEKNLTEDLLVRIARDIELIPETRQVLEGLKTRNISLHIVSGSIKKIVLEALGGVAILFDNISANDMRFDGKTGALLEIVGTKYDFKGKAHYISDIINREKLNPLEVLYVGNSGNDIWASQSGARTLCVNPHFTDPTVVKHWTYAIRKMDSLDEILQFI